MIGSCRFLFLGLEEAARPHNYLEDTMKRLLTLVAVLLLAGTVMAESAPTFIGGGAILTKGTDGRFAFQTAANVNILSKQASWDSTQTLGQVYTRLGAIVADDISLTEQESTELEAFSGYLIVDGFIQNYFVGIGVGTMIEPKDGSNDRQYPVMVHCGWRPVKVVTVELGLQYIPIQDVADLYFPYVGIGLWFGD
jgi:hypothetical protein